MNSFPITIPFERGHRPRSFANVEALAAYMEERAIYGMVDHRGQDYPSEHFQDVWLGDDRDPERVKLALAEAGTWLMQRSDEPFVIQMVLMLVVDVPYAPYYEALLDRLEGRPRPLPEGRMPNAWSLEEGARARLALDGVARRQDPALDARVRAFQEQAASVDVFPIDLVVGEREPRAFQSAEELADGLAAVAHQGLEHPGQMYPADRVRSDGQAGRMALGIAGSLLLTRATHPDEVQLALHVCDNCPYMPFYHAILDRLDSGTRVGTSSEGNDVDAMLVQALIAYNALQDSAVARRASRYLAP